MSREFSFELENVSILVNLDTIVKDRAHTPETNHNPVSEAKDRCREVSPYPRRSGSSFET